jgi:formate hydrogenlyase subunit 6/NADH:ubiquinone oxidoreductase subunit I
MLDTGIIQTVEDPATGELVEQAEAVFVVDDNACTRCSVCVERCPSDCLYYARLPEGTGDGQRTMGTVPMSQQAEEPA